MRSSSDIFKAVGTEVFGETQETFGRRLLLTKETISRLEGRKAGHYVSIRHLRLLRGLRPPRDQAGKLEALLVELDAALQREMAAEGAGLAQVAVLAGVDASGRGPEVAVTEGVGKAGQDAESASAAERAATRAESAAERVERLLAAEEARRAEEARQRQEEAEHAKRLRLAEEARRAEDARKQEESVQRVVEAAERLAQLRVTDEAHRAEEARKKGAEARAAEEEARQAEERRVSERRQTRRLLLATLAMSAALGALGGVASRAFEAPRTDVDRMSAEQAAGQETRTPEVAPSERGVPEEDLDAEEALSAGMDAGTAMTELLMQAIPMPRGPVP
ncbi:MAG TPA: hypothetical protein VK420_17885, partial [Longimicrobium sp.]|nr:hypothetical protein [Longimicrobium sp.]